MAVLYAGAEWVGNTHPENYFVGRIGYGINDSGHQYTITAIGLHHTATTLQGAIATFQAAPASGHQHSAHFIVDLDGKRYQMLDTDDTAFSLGDEAGNCYSVNIEVVQTWDFNANVKTSDFTDAQYASVTDICRIVAADNGFPVDAAHIHGHNFWTPTTCPADFDIPRISTGGADMDPDTLAKLQAFLNGAAGGAGQGGGYDFGGIRQWWADGGQGAPNAAFKTELDQILAHPAVVTADPQILTLLQQLRSKFA